ncbi:hypothetical protein AM500_03220 [Bacillus sp. FJAT-18017]|uniref:cell wall-binding repeat-containing protein n=1 Tax=Bacillus sp. FJAT-18017 TaxID=1705566 RepID=UPI0006AED9CB|nr:cell wall-binding repeat-containing protein [Bacillus sp. FJAT-18017]ALC88920.1 hypothetical protein AM500_03220 [Bacillus sp. FJAT-18017]
MRKIFYFVLIAIISCLPVIHSPFSVNAASTSIAYKSKINGQSSHKYIFTTSTSSIVTINNLLTNNIDVYAVIVDSTTGENYISGDALPAGTYNFIVSNNNSLALDYSYTLSGPTFLTNVSSMPSLNITDPAAYFTKLPKGVFGISLSGSSTGENYYSSTYYNINGSQNMGLSNPFKVTIPISFGRNFLSISTGSSNYINTINKEILAPGLKRLGGTTVFDTSVLVSKEISNLNYKSNTVIITNAEKHWDGIAATVLAYENKAPILFTQSDAIPIAIENEIYRLKPTKAIIVGSTAVVTSTVESKLKALGIAEVQRVGGATRYDTSVAVAKQIVGPENDTAIIVNGESIPSQINIASVAAQSKIPVLTTTSTSVPTVTETFIKENPSILNFIVIGNETEIGTTVTSKLDQYGNVSRIDNLNRYDLGVNISNYFFVEPTSFIIARGDVYSSGVIAGPLAALKNYKVLLTPYNNLNTDVENYLIANQDYLENFYIMGTSITTDVTNKLDSFVR